MGGGGGTEENRWNVEEERLCAAHAFRNGLNRVWQSTRKSDMTDTDCEEVKWIELAETIRQNNDH
jgi:hypothetical protein